MDKIIVKSVKVLDNEHIQYAIKINDTVYQFNRSLFEILCKELEDIIEIPAERAKLKAVWIKDGVLYGSTTGINNSVFILGNESDKSKWLQKKGLDWSKIVLTENPIKLK